MGSPPRVAARRGYLARVAHLVASVARLLARVVQGVLALTVLAALLGGLPWALIHYIGWPLPRHLPTGEEVRALLLSPMTPTFLLDVLAVACWIAWAAFALDTARATIDAVRGAHLPDRSAASARAAAGPLRTFAAVLIGAIVLSLLGQRHTTVGAASTTGFSDVVGGHAPVVATTVWQQPAPTHPRGFALAPAGPPGRAAERQPVDLAARLTRPATAPSSVTASTVVVRTPVNGVHDSLWRLARDTLGNPDRWPEIFALNQGAPQTGGHRLTVPSLIYPGEELRLPPGAHPYAPDALTATTPPAAVPSRPLAPSTTPPASTPPTPAPITSAPATTPAAPAPSTGVAASGAARPTSTPAMAGPAPARSPAPLSGRHSGLQLGTGIFLGLGLAAAVSAALMLARYRYRRGYQPGSGRRDDLPVAPVVYQLQLAHLRTTRDNSDYDLDDSADDDQARGERGGPGTATPLVITNRQPSADDPDPVAPSIGVRDGRDIALDLACAPGLGLVGAGAPAAIRALLLTLLAPPPRPRANSSASAPTPGATVFVPATDLAGLLGSPRTHTHLLPDAVRVTTDLDAALDDVETEILRRTREHHDNADNADNADNGLYSGTAAGMNNETAARDAEWPPIVIVATPPGYAPQRLQAVLDNGATVGVLGVLLGQWRPGVTAYVTTDGRVSATSPGLGESLRGAQVFQLPEPDAADLLALLRLAQPPPRYPEPRDPAASGRPGWQHHDEHPPTMPATHSQSRQGAGSASGDEHDPGEWDEAIASPATDLGYDEGVLEVTAPAHGGLEITGASPARRQSHPRLTSAPPPARTRPPSDDRRHEDHPRGAAIPSTADITNGQGVNGAAAGTTERACETADETATTSAPVVLTVLGPVRVHWHSPGHSDAATDPSGAAHEITASLGPRQRELLAFLAVHRDGVTRDALVAALWPDGRPDRPTNALNAILGRLRRSLAAATDGAVSEILLAGDGRYRLDPAWIEVDLWYFQDAVAARRAATTDAERIAAYRRVVAAYGGKLAEGTEAEWLDVEADAIRRDAIDAVAALARAMVEHDPAQTLELLEAARTRDPYNELLYRDIMRLQDRLGRHDAISRTLTQLTKRLADINDKPSRQAVELATQLQNRHAALADTPAAPPPRGSSTSPAATRGPRVEHHRAARATHPTAGTRHSNAINR